MSPQKKTDLAVAAALGLCLLAAGGTVARADEAKPREATIIVSGDGQSAAAPDMAILTLAVVQQAVSAREALNANNKAMADVLAALKKEGLAERDLQTSGFNITPQYNYPVDKEGRSLPPVLSGYQATNTLTVRLRELAKLGTLLDEAVTLGINQGGDIRFTNDKPQPIITEARKAAVADALSKAKVLTEAAGVKLGRIIEISENFARPEPQPVFRAAMAKEMSDAGAVPVAGGENSYSVTVNVTFSLEQ